MFNIALFGKRYEDTILSIEELTEGETNACNNKLQRLGGIYNMEAVKLPGVMYTLLPSGTKEAYIISDKRRSKRTSLVVDKSSCTLSDSTIKKINLADWLHICYIDDIECEESLFNINVPISIDFCTSKDRKSYTNIMEKSTIIFDSRERKLLYDGLNVTTPIIFHDEKGIEIYQNGVTLYRGDNTPISNLEVNGAGDIFAAIFIHNYTHKNHFLSADIAMRETTNHLIKRNNYEQKI